MYSSFPILKLQEPMYSVSGDTIFLVQLATCMYVCNHLCHNPTFGEPSPMHKLTLHACYLPPGDVLKQKCASRSHCTLQ